MTFALAWRIEESKNKKQKQIIDYPAHFSAQPHHAKKAKPIGVTTTLMPHHLFSLAKIKIIVLEKII